MRRVVAAVSLAAALAVTVTGCQIEPDLKTRPVALAFPTGMVPPSIDGLTVDPEPSAQSAFEAIGSNSAVAHGEVWTVRQGGLVVGSIQVSQLKGGLSTKSERVRVGIRSAVNDIPFRWFKALHRQWVGVQEQPQLAIYLWMPPRDDVYVVAQLKSSLPDPERIVTDLIAYEENAR